MKKFFAFLMAAVLMLSLSIPAFATGTTGSITITNATIGQTYYLYKIFDATYAVDENGKTKVDAEGNVIASYTISSDNQFFDDLFGVDGKTENEFFIYDSNTGVVTRRESVLDEQITDYLDRVANSGQITPDRSIPAQQSTVVFDNIPTGYYLIDRGIASTVTITSNVPTVKVIDKNQKPNVDDSFSKLVWDEDNSEWVSSSSANIGDIIDWKLNFVATNYDGDEQVLYYVIRDIKSSSLWVEFNSIAVKVNGEDLGLGYYWCAGDPDIDTLDWTAAKDPTQWAENPDDASWYLIHYGFDEFEIVIPWLDDYTFTGETSAIKGYELTFDLSKEDENETFSESKYDSPGAVEITYSASVGPDAANIVSQNSATLDWVIPEGTFGPENPETTDTRVYNLGITKTANDGTSTTAATRLAGAIFEIYKDRDYTQPVYVIPTNNEGVYILDDVATDVSGANRITARERYLGYWETYLGSEQKKNVVETPASGQVVIMGLEAGTYFLKEIEAPKGYNRIGTPIEAIVGSGTTSVFNNSYKDLSNNDITYTVYNTPVINNSGMELPSTGSVGTMRMITIGTMVAVVFAVLLITHKKMSIYSD